MKVLLLSKSLTLKTFLIEYDEDVTVTMEKIDPDFVEEFDFIVSYGYRHIISKDVIDAMDGNIINLHISYLPYNRGADPVFWGVVDDTPMGVTIHKIDEGIDTGNILVRRVYYRNKEDSLRQIYADLSGMIEGLFCAWWPILKANYAVGFKQVGKSTYHKSSDKEVYTEEILNYLDIPVSGLLEHISEIQMSDQLWDNYKKEIEQQ